MRTLITALLVFCFVSAATAQQKDDFKRERSPKRKEQSAAKDALEGKAPPKLQVSDWMNAPKGGLELAKLKGKVVILDFWGVW